MSQIFLISGLKWARSVWVQPEWLGLLLGTEKPWFDSALQGLIPRVRLQTIFSKTVGPLCKGSWLPILYFGYNEDLKSDHLKSRNIWNLDFIKIRFQMVWFLKGWSQPFTNQTVQTPNMFVCISNGFWQNSCHLSRFQIPFEIRTVCKPTSFWTFKIQI